MTDKQFKETKDALQKLLDEWRPLLGLDEGIWNIEIEFHRVEDEKGALGRAFAQWEYLQGHIDLYCPEFQFKDGFEREMVVLHELCHFLVKEMREWGPDNLSENDVAVGRKHEERVVTQLSRCFLRTKYAKLKMAKGKGD